jgi:hypothetical protein
MEGQFTNLYQNDNAGRIIAAQCKEKRATLMHFQPNRPLRPFDDPAEQV